MPGERPAFASEQVLTRRRPNETTEEVAGDPAPSGDMGATGGSVMREWVDELTGRREGGRVPSAAEIAELTAVFPHASRQEVVDALQRRYVVSVPLCLRELIAFGSQTVDQAASVLLTRSS
jgi:hypothetical protein